MAKKKASKTNKNTGKMPPSTKTMTQHMGDGSMMDPMQMMQDHESKRQSKKKSR